MVEFYARCVMRTELNDGSGQDDGAFGNDGDAVADVVIVAVEVEIVGLASDDDAVADAGIFVDDAMFHGNVSPDAQGDAVSEFFVGVEAFGVFFVVEVGAHHDDFFKAGAGADDAAHADDGVGNNGAVEIGAFGDEAVADGRTDDAGGGKRPHMREERLPGAVERKRRVDLRGLDIGLIERRNCPDVGPISFVQMRGDADVAQEPGDDLAAEIVVGALQARFEQFAVEDVDAHAREIPFFVGVESDAAAERFGGAETFDDGGIFGFFDEFLNHAFIVDAQKPHARGVVAVDEIDGDRETGLFASVAGQHFRIIHAIEVIARQNERFFAGKMADVMERGADGVGRAHEPFLAAFGLFGGQDFDEPVRERIEFVGFHDVPVKACAQELGEHEDAVNARIDAIGERHIDEPILSEERNGGFGAFMG